MDFGGTSMEDIKRNSPERLAALTAQTVSVEELERNWPERRAALIAATRATMITMEELGAKFRALGAAMTRQEGDQ